MFLQYIKHDVDLFVCVAHLHCSTQGEKYIRSNLYLLESILEVSSVRVIWWIC